MQLSEAATVVNGQLQGNDHLFTGVTIDSRQTYRGDLFVAIPGEVRDGHDFVGAAHQKGAVGALVSNAVKNNIDQILVGDTTLAMGQLAAHWRNSFDLPVVAVTGSNGKTTVTAMIASIFNYAGNCLSPKGSFNNQWGVPLTLLRIREDHTHVVIEMGMNAPGEIDYLTGLVKPTVALINNIAPAHLEGLGNIENVADAKIEIFNGVAPATGTLVLNLDDAFFDRCRQRAGGREIVTFGVDPSADVHAGRLAIHQLGSTFELQIMGHNFDINLPLLGRHNVMNALAAAAAAYAAGAGLDPIKAGLESFVAVTGRLRTLTGAHGELVIDDSYNANPASIRAALDVLAGFSGKRIAVLGAMAELGGESDRLHHEVGIYARDCGIEKLLCMGPEDHSGITGYLAGFGSRAVRFSNVSALLAHLLPLLNEEGTVLIKGSRSSAMERVVAGLVPDNGEAAAC